MQLIKQVQELCQARKFDAAVSVCQSPILLAQGACPAHRRGSSQTAKKS